MPGNLEQGATQRRLHSNWEGHCHHGYWRHNVASLDLILVHSLCQEASILGKQADCLTTPGSTSCALEACRSCPQSGPEEEDHSPNDSVCDHQVGKLY